jgi:hypothetical protein
MGRQSIPHFLVVAAVVFGHACQVSEPAAAPTEPVSRIFPAGEGKVIHFDLHPATGSALVIRTKDAQAQRRGDALMVNFDAVQFSRPQNELREVAVQTFRVLVYKTEQAANTEPIGKSREKDLRDANLNGGYPHYTARSMEFEVPNVGSQCDSACVVSASATYSVVTSSQAALGGLVKAEFSKVSVADSAPVELQLAVGKAVAPKTYEAPANLTGDPRTDVCSPKTHWGLAQATAALGMPMHFYSPTAGNCTMAPPENTVPYFYISVVDYPHMVDNEFSKVDGAQVIELPGTQTAVWNPKTLVLAAQTQDQSLTVEVPGLRGPRGEARARSVAVSVSTKILASLRP